MTKPGEFSPATVQLIWDRDKGRCVLCGDRLVWERRGPGGWSVHHREDRGMGGVKKARPGRVQPRAYLALPSNGILLCGDGVAGCHGKVTREEVPDELGFTVSRIGIRRPVEVRISHFIHGWVRLDDAGGWETAA